MIDIQLALVSVIFRHSSWSPPVALQKRGKVTAFQQNANSQLPVVDATHSIRIGKMFWNSDNHLKDEDTSASADNYGPLSSQSKMISTALRQADKAIKQANYMFSQGTSTRKDTVDDPNFSEHGSSDDGSSTYAGTMADLNTIKTGADSKSTAPSLNLRQNDSQFHVIAGFVVSKFEHFLTSGAKSFALSVDDKQQLDRIVSRDNFVEAVRYRIQYCPKKPVKPIHVLTRHCHALGLHRSGNQNLLYAPAGTIIEIEVSKCVRLRKPRLFDAHFLALL